MRRFSIVGLLVVGTALALAFVMVGIRLVGRSWVSVSSSGSIQGLSATATIARDQNGIAYISADNENDAMASLGYAHAQDRLWQMELARRAGSGRLSEIFGSRALTYDRFMRTVGFQRVAEKIVAAMPKTTLATLQAYANGVNAFIESHRGHYPMEFDALGYEPEKWTPIHSVIVSRLMAWQLNPALWTDIVFGDIQSRVDSVRFSEILPYTSPDAPTILGSGQVSRNSPDTSAGKPAAVTPTAAKRIDKTKSALPGRISSVLRPVMDIEQSMREFMGISGSGVGSNAWVISGSRTEKGKPILASDPHLQLRAPAQWYQVVIMTKSNTLAGVTIAGAPFVVIGRNRNISWGITSLMGDETDYYIEQLDSARHKFMLHADKWIPLSILRDTIVVKDSAQVPITIRVGLHGPLVSDVHPFVTNIDKVTDIKNLHKDTASILLDHPISMCWNGLDPSQELAAWQGVNNAKTFDAFRSALLLGGCPSLSFVYADAAGNIGYVPTMRVPIRERSTLPNPGWDARYDWKGYVPQNQLPTMFNPPSGVIATANNRMGGTQSYVIGELWEDESRAVRLKQLLGEGRNYTTIDVGQMQMDVVSPFTNMMLGYLLRAFPDSAKQGPAVREAIARLRTWAGALLPDSPEAAIVNAWITQVLEMTYRDEMGPTLYAEFLLPGMLAVRAIRHHVDIDSRWFDDVSTPRKVETRDDILRAALGAALDKLHDKFATWEIQKWRYGAMHTMTFRHAFSEQKALQNVVDIGPFEVGGNSTTLNKGEWSFTQPYQVKVGPSMRQIVDFADTMAYVRSIIPTGASGQPLDKYYANQTTLWLIGGLLVLNDRMPTPSETSSTTTLSPN